MPLLLTILLILLITGGAIFIAQCSGLDARARGIPSIIVGLIGIFVLVSYLV